MGEALAINEETTVTRNVAQQMVKIVPEKMKGRPRKEDFLKVNKNEDPNVASTPQLIACAMRQSKRAQLIEASRSKVRALK